MPTGSNWCARLPYRYVLRPRRAIKSAATVAAATASIARLSERDWTASTRSTSCSTSRMGRICRATAGTALSASMATSSSSTTRARAAHARVRFRARCGASRGYARSSPTSKSSRHRRRQHVALYASTRHAAHRCRRAFDGAFHRLAGVARRVQPRRSKLSANLTVATFLNACERRRSGLGHVINRGLMAGCCRPRSHLNVGRAAFSSGSRRYQDRSVARPLPLTRQDGQGGSERLGCDQAAGLESRRRWCGVSPNSSSIIVSRRK